MVTTTSPAARAPRVVQPRTTSVQPRLAAALAALERHAERLLHRCIAARLAHECNSPIRPLSRRGRWDWA